jgi:hypothetical protein
LQRLVFRLNVPVPFFVPKSPTEAAQQAIKATPFGKARIKFGYGDFGVTATKLEPVDLGGELGTQRVPTIVKVSARLTPGTGE